LRTAKRCLRQIKTRARIGAGPILDGAQAHPAANDNERPNPVEFVAPLTPTSGKTTMPRIRLLFAACLLASTLAFAADTSPPASRDTELEKAKTAIARKDWVAAQALLEPYTLVNSRSADGFNLLGYSLRNLKKYDESLVAYKQALTLDPKHKGAHEYIGIAYVQMGQLDKAKEHLASLDKICPFSCEEYRDLKKAIAQAQ
jgi:tetratricopeptide (TPR) repeat protein